MKTYISSCIFILGLFIALGTDAADSNISSEETLKAIYLIHISKMTTWLEGANNSSNFSICINKTSTLSPKLKQLEGQLNIKGKPLKIQHNLSLKQLLNCNVFYISNSTDNLLFKQYQLELETNAVLTVSDEANFFSFTKNGGGVIGYYIDNNKVKMHINLKTMRRTGINISSKLLRLMIPRS